MSSVEQILKKCFTGEEEQKKKGTLSPFCIYWNT